MADNNELHERYFPPQKVTYPQIYAYRMKHEPDELKVGFTNQKDVSDRIAGVSQGRNYESGASALQESNWYYGSGV